MKNTPLKPPGQPSAGLLECGSALSFVVQTGYAKR
jgi:hypothetical protein